MVFFFFSGATVAAKGAKVDSMYSLYKVGLPKVGPYDRYTWSYGAPISRVKFHPIYPFIALLITIGSGPTLYLPKNPRSPYGPNFVPW